MTRQPGDRDQQLRQEEGHQELTPEAALTQWHLRPNSDQSFPSAPRAQASGEAGRPEPEMTGEAATRNLLGQGAARRLWAGHSNPSWQGGALPKGASGEASAPAFAHPQAAWGTEGLTGASTGSLGFKGRAGLTPGSAASLLSPLQALSPCSAHKPHPCSQARRSAIRERWISHHQAGRGRQEVQAQPGYHPSLIP